MNFKKKLRGKTSQPYFIKRQQASADIGSHAVLKYVCTGCFNPSVNFDTILISHIHGAIPKPFNVVIVHMVRFDIMYDNPSKLKIYPS